MSNRVIPEFNRTKFRSGNKNFIISKLIPSGAELVCADNSGAKTLQVIGYKKHQSTRKRYPTGGVGDICVVRVVKGPVALKKQWHYALIVRQKTPITRRTGSTMGKVCFHDNAAVLLDKQKSGKKYYYKMKRVQVKGPVAKQIYQINKKFDNILGDHR